MAELTQAQKDAEAQSRTETQAAKVGAQAVADAVQKVAQQVANAVAGAQPKLEGANDFIVTAVPGGRFRLDAPARTFGASGTVRIGNRQLETNGWSAQRIEGAFPADVKPGAEVTVHVSEGVTKRGVFRG